MSLIYPCVYCTDDLHCTKYTEPGYESWCVLGPCTAETPSNGDMIRRMTDEELAQFFHDCVACDDCPVGDSKCKRAFALCKNTALLWLKSPVEVDNGT